jgi:ABC-type branched-subunit amino acid transport system substrate-binding protein
MLHFTWGMAMTGLSERGRGGPDPREPFDPGHAIDQFGDQHEPARPQRWGDDTMARYRLPAFPDPPPPNRTSSFAPLLIGLVVLVTASAVYAGLTFGPRWIDKKHTPDRAPSGETRPPAPPRTAAAQLPAATPSELPPPIAAQVPSARGAEVTGGIPAANAVPVSPTVQGVTSTEIRFGMVAPFTGPAKEMGHQLKLGIEAAFAVANEGGGVNGRLLKLVTADDGYEPARTLDAMRELYEKNQVFGFIDNYGSPTALISVPYALEHHAIYFGAFSGANSLRSDPPDRYVFNYRAAYAEETGAIVRYLVKIRRLRPDEIAVLTQQDAYGDAGMDGVARAVRGLRGGNPGAIVRMTYNRNTVNVDDAVAQLRRLKNQIKAVVLVATFRPAAKFVEKTRDAYPDMIYATISGVGSTGLADELKLLGPRYANGVVVTQVVPAVDGYASLILAYKKALAKYAPGEVADYVSLESYLTANILIEGLRRTGPQFDTETLIDTMEHLRNFDMGLGPPVNFGTAEHQAVHKVWGTQLDDTGHYHAIDLE